jgi:hypothetical protein
MTSTTYQPRIPWERSADPDAFHFFAAYTGPYQVTLDARALFDDETGEWKLRWTVENFTTGERVAAGYADTKDEAIQAVEAIVRGGK